MHLEKQLGSKRAVCLGPLINSLQISLPKMNYCRRCIVCWIGDSTWHHEDKLALKCSRELHGIIAHVASHANSHFLGCLGKLLHVLSIGNIINKSFQQWITPFKRRHRNWRRSCRATCADLMMIVVSTATSPVASCSAATFTSTTHSSIWLRSRHVSSLVVL